MSDRGRSSLPLLLVFTLLMLTSAAASGASGIRSLDADFLLGKKALRAPLPTQVFTPPDTAQLPAQPFEGLLTLDAKTGSSRIKTLVDTYRISRDKSLNVTTLPPFSFEYVSDGPVLIPVKREPQRSTHPYWEIILEPGRTWTDEADEGWSRAALPFALKEKNQNCTHNGLMTFLYKPDGAISRVAWQITSETCLYLKVNLWGTLDADYSPGPVPASGELVSAWRNEVKNRLPVRPFSSLALDYPGLDPAAFEPSGVADASVYGLVLGGIHYRSECPTRYGPYPFCDVLDLPSYSLAKSLFAGLTYLLVNTRWPEFSAIPIASLVPECKLPDGRWDQVLPAHLVNMTTGNYGSDEFNADEDNAQSAFFLAESHAARLRFSCETWPGQSPAGKKWVYHSSDTYLLGVAMNNFLKQKLGDGADIHRSLLYPELFQPLGLSPVLQWAQRTYDNASQPLTGYGLILHSDDLARIALALNTGSVIGKALAATDFDSAMFRSGGPWPAPPGTQGLAYSNGFWGIEVSSWIDCPSATWLPFMSGFGGLVVVLLPAGGVYYFFTDSNQHSFRNAIVEANKALNFCKE